MRNCVEDGSRFAVPRLKIAESAFNTLDLGGRKERGEVRFVLWIWPNARRRRKKEGGGETEVRPKFPAESNAGGEEPSIKAGLRDGGGREKVEVVVCTIDQWREKMVIVWETGTRVREATEMGGNAGSSSPEEEGTARVNQVPAPVHTN